MELFDFWYNVTLLLKAALRDLTRKHRCSAKARNNDMSYAVCYALNRVLLVKLFTLAIETHVWQINGTGFLYFNNQQMKILALY